MVRDGVQQSPCRAVRAAFKRPGNGIAGGDVICGDKTITVNGDQRRVFQNELTLVMVVPFGVRVLIDGPERFLPQCAVTIGVGGGGTGDFRGSEIEIELGKLDAVCREIVAQFCRGKAEPAIGDGSIRHGVYSDRSGRAASGIGGRQRVRLV